MHTLVLLNHSVVRSVKWGDGSQFFATAADPFTSRDLGTISIFEFPTEEQLSEGTCMSGWCCQLCEARLFATQNFDVSKSFCEFVLTIPLLYFPLTRAVPSTKKDDPAPLHTPNEVISVDDNDKATCIGWTIADQHIMAGFDSGLIVKYDAETGKEVQRKKLHTDRVNRLNFNRDKSMMITASKDCSALLIDPANLEVVRLYRTERPVNGAVISPTHPHILLGGGQDAQTVTTTSASQGKFETRFYHTIYGEEFGRVRGHFGPINALDVHPFGRSFASGSEDG